MARAIAQVCTTDAPRVWVTRAHAAALDVLRDPARQALAILAAKLPAPPTSVVEDYGDASPDAQPQRADTILVGGLSGLVRRDASAARALEGGASDPSRAILWQLLDGAGTRGCCSPSLSGRGPRELLDRYVSARVVAAAWLLGRAPPVPEQATEPPDDRAQAVWALAVRTLSTLRSLPADEQRARVAALRQAELACDGRDLLDILVGPGGQR